MFKLSGVVEVDERPIGVTDSGVGGLSVLARAMELLPNERFVYLADTRFMPYGDKSSAEVCNRVNYLVDTLFEEYQCKAVVLACNTATAVAAPFVRDRHPGMPIIGIEPAVKPAAMMTQTGKVGILATANTLASNRFKDLVARFDRVAEVYASPCPGLVELIEQVPMPLAKIDDLLAEKLSGLLKNDVDVVVLGCTHYPFVADRVQRIVGPNVQVVETGLPVAKQLKVKLEEGGLIGAPLGNLMSDCTSAPVMCLTTGDKSTFDNQLHSLLGQSWASVGVNL